MDQRLAVACLALCLSGAALAGTAPPATAATTPETLWVAPRQTLPLLALPQLGAPVVASVGTGDALTVLGRQGDFVQLRTAAGVVGWSRSSALIADPPAPPADLAADNARLAQQVTTLDAQVRAFQDENAQLRRQLDGVENELALHTRVVPLTPAGVFGFIKRQAVEPATWIAALVLLLALLFAFRAGVAHRNDSIRQRFGGLDL
jgi:hypothetical protein